VWKIISGEMKQNGVIVKGGRTAEASRNMSARRCGEGERERGWGGGGVSRKLGKL
jgi:hypothetical protein